MSYIKTGAAHTNQLTEDLYGNEQTRYSRYETGFIEGEYRDMLALIADETGFDGFGFDVNAGSNDDSWHVVNLFENGGHYIDSVAIGGALDEDHALTLATTQFDYLGADYGVLVGYAEGMQFDHMTDDQAWSIDAISKLLNNPSQDKHYLPIITSKELQEEATRAAFNDVQWDNLTLSSHGGSLTNLYTDMIRADTFKELTQEFDLQQALIDLEAEEAEFDSIMETVNRLPMLKDRLFRAMSQASNETLSVTNVTQTKPFKRGGVVNVAFVFDLSDGQKLSIWFHNPDSTPSKLLAGDMMVSWKWLLNKRDVTAILSPVNGQTVKIPTLARKMMLLASKNSKTFKRAQERKAKRDADINEAKSNIEKKKQTIEQLDNDIASLKDQIDAAMKANKGKADKDTTETTNDDSSQDVNIQLNSIDIDSLDIEPRYKKRLIAGVQSGLGILDTATQTRLKQSIESLKTQLNSMGVAFISEAEYQEKINSNEESGFSVQSLQDDLKESVSQLHKLINKQIRPSKIVGTGYKDNRAVAFENLGLNIAENEVVLRTQPSGFYKTVNLSNYETYLDVLVSSSKKANEEAAITNDAVLSSFIDQATKNGWQLDISTLGQDEKELSKTISDTDVLLEVTNEGYNAMTVEGDVLSYGEADSLNNFNETNRKIEADVASHEQETGAENKGDSVLNIVKSDRTKEEKLDILNRILNSLTSQAKHLGRKVDKSAAYYKTARKESENYGFIEPNFWVRNGIKKPTANMDYGLAVAEVEGAIYFVEQDKGLLENAINSIKEFSKGKPGYKGVASYPADAIRSVESLQPGDWMALPNAVNAAEVSIYFKSPFGDVQSVTAKGIESAYTQMRNDFFELIDKKELADEKIATENKVQDMFGKSMDDLIDEYYGSSQGQELRAKRNKVWDFEEAINNYAEGRISDQQLLSGPAGELKSVRNKVAANGSTTAEIAKDDYYQNPEDAPKAAAAETGKPNYNTTKDLTDAQELTVSYTNTSGKIGAKIVYYFNEDGSENGYKISGEWKAPSRGDNPTGSHAEMLSFEKFIKENRKVKSVSDRVKYFNKGGEKAARFAEIMTSKGWQLEILTINDKVKKLHKRVNGMDLTLEVHDQGFDVSTKDGQEVYFGSQSELSDPDAVNVMIEKAVSDMKDTSATEPASVAEPANTAYSQEDIDFLNTIIAGDFDPDNVDMDKMIEIGEKDENDPLYEQAINIVLEALDEASSNL